MNVQCPSCSTTFRVDPAKVPAGGVRARCSVCAAVFPVSVTPVAGAAADVAPPPDRATAAAAGPLAAAPSPPPVEPVSAAGASTRRRRRRPRRPRPRPGRCRRRRSSRRRFPGARPAASRPARHHRRAAADGRPPRRRRRRPAGQSRSCRRTRRSRRADWPGPWCPTWWCTIRPSGRDALKAGTLKELVQGGDHEELGGVRRAGGPRARRLDAVLPGSAQRDPGGRQPDLLSRVRRER